MADVEPALAGPSQARPSCPACDSRQPEARSAIAFCSGCGHRWLVSTAEDHRAREEEIFTEDYSGFSEDERFVAFVRRFTRDELARRLRPGAKILDVGCGAGHFMQVAKEAGYSVEGIDVSPASAQICRQKGLDARSGDFLTERFGGKFDLITMWDVVEHLRDPAAFLERARGLLAEGGMLFSKIPIFGELSVRLSDKVPRAAGILLGAPDHVQYFDRESLERLIRRVRFEPEWLSPASIRSPTTGGSLKRRVARRVQTVIKAASGDGNAFVMATPA